MAARSKCRATTNTSVSSRDWQYHVCTRSSLLQSNRKVSCKEQLADHRAAGRGGLNPPEMN